VGAQAAHTRRSAPKAHPGKGPVTITGQPKARPKTTINTPTVMTTPTSSPAPPATITTQLREPTARLEVARAARRASTDAVQHGQEPDTDKHTAATDRSTERERLAAKHTRAPKTNHIRAPAAPAATAPRAATQPIEPTATTGRSRPAADQRRQPSTPHTARGADRHNQPAQPTSPTSGTPIQTTTTPTNHPAKITNPQTAKTTNAVPAHPDHANQPHPPAATQAQPTKQEPSRSPPAPEPGQHSRHSFQ
jgi:hypothetical protein